MSGMLTLTEIPGNKFRKFARTSDFDTLHNTNNTNNLPDTIVKAEQFNRNSIRVIRKTIAVNAVIDCYVDETDKEFSDIKCNADHKKTRTDDKIIYKGDSSGIFGVKSKGYRQKHELDNDQSSGFEEIVPNKNDEISREHKDELNMHCKLDLNRCNQAKDSRSFISERTSDKLGMKVCGYRPGTTIDNFRRDFQIDNSEKENVVEGLDIEEGNRIWNDVNKIINRRDYKARRNTCLSERFGGSNASLVSSETECHSKSAEYSRSSKNSIEFSPRFSSRNHKRSWRHVNRIWSYEGLQSDRNCTLINNGTGPSKLGGFKNRKISDVFPDGVEKTRLPVRWTGLINNIWSTVDNMIGFKQDQSKKTNNSRRWRWSVMGECKDKSVAMTTMLPRITPSSTPLPTGITQPPPRSHSSASMYVPYPPKELSSSIDFVRIPGRINPLAPPPPRRRINWSWETTDQHYENEKRSLLMQKREHTRYHSAWSKAFYGAPAEKEAYRRHYREVLKQQMSDKNAMAKEEFKHKLKETEQAISYDNNCRKNDAQEYHRKHSYLMQYRDTNKQQMEDRWAQTRQSRDVENRVDRERLRYNPINWSCSLK